MPRESVRHFILLLSVYVQAGYSIIGRSMLQPLEALRRYSFCQTADTAAVSAQFSP